MTEPKTGVILTWIILAVCVVTMFFVVFTHKKEDKTLEVKIPSLNLPQKTTPPVTK